ncbi:MAG: BrnT family toxin [Elusimicrobiota bacterium]
MEIVSEPIFFEWNKGNIDKNLRKHNVANRETEEVFENDPKFIFRDEKHSQKEERYGLYGKTKAERLLFVVFTIKRDKVRVISARNMSKKERRVYEEKIKGYPKI